MKLYWIVGIVLVVAVAAAGLALVYGGALVYAQVATDKRGADTPPAQVVTNFYDWLLNYARGPEGTRNPVVDGAYRTSEYLAEAFVAEVDEAVASRKRGDGDPFLLAQDIPEQFTVGKATVSGDQATVALDLYWGGNPTPSQREVRMERIDGKWVIAGVSIPEPGK